MGRAMKEWVVVPRSHEKRWPALAHEAFEYVSAGAPAKKASAGAKAKAPAKPKGRAR
jgi:hypothetical protein